MLNGVFFALLDTILISVLMASVKSLKSEERMKKKILINKKSAEDEQAKKG